MELTFNGVLYVSIIAVLAPFVASLAPKLRMPAVALEILIGMAVGPSGLDWVSMDVPLNVLGTIGLAYLLFLAGLELDLTILQGRFCRLFGAWAVTCALALAVGYGFHLIDLHDSTLIVAVALTATSLGLVVPIIHEAGESRSQFGQTVLGACSIGEFGSLLLLSILFSTTGSTTSTQIFLVGVFVVAATVLGLTLARLNRSAAVWSTLERFAETSSQLTVRAMIVVLLLFLVVATRLGFEAILGTFVAGALLKFLDHEGKLDDPRLKAKIEAIGYGFLVPIFFITSGIQVDLSALFDRPKSLLLIPLLVVGLLITRGLPALLYRPLFDNRRVLVAGLLQGTTLSFMVIVASVATQLNDLDKATAAALVAAGVVSVLLFPPIAVGLLPKGESIAADWDEPAE
ncbi:MAG: cation:proton antiporter [Actinobacteria bacterium]|nr:cation:proton antiporter [Actinomycetota bacterium]